MIEIPCSSESSSRRAPRKPAVHATSATSGARRRSASGPMVATSPASSSKFDGRSYDGSPSRYRLIQERDERTATPSSAAASSASAASGWDRIQAATYPAVRLTGATLTAADVGRIALRSHRGRYVKCTCGQRRDGPSSNAERRAPGGKGTDGGPPA